MIRRRACMVYLLRTSGWRCTVVASEFLDIPPIGQEPCLEIVLRDVRMKCGMRAYPMAHFIFRICGIDKIVGTCINVGQGNDGIRRLAPGKQILDSPAQFILLRNSTVVEEHIKAGHSASEPSPEECVEMELECLLGSAFYQNCNLQGRAPRRPLLQSSSRE